MPILYVGSVEFDEYNKKYKVKLNELKNVVPHIGKDKNLEFYLLEIRDENGKLIRRFKPFKKINVKVIETYYNYYNRNVPAIELDEDLCPNIAKNYKIGLIITKYDDKIILPFELKATYEAERLMEYLHPIEKELLTLVLENPALNEAKSYLFDSYLRLEENDIEGSRTSLRKSLEIIESNIIKNIQVVNTEEESEELPDYLKKLIKSMKKFVHYGGPHPGPAPRSTTVLILNLTIDIIEYLAKCLQNRMIKLTSKRNKDLKHENQLRKNNKYKDV